MCDNHDNDWDDNENYCEGLTEDECFEAEVANGMMERMLSFEDDEDNQFDSFRYENLEECENIADVSGCTAIISSIWFC